MYIFNFGLDFSFMLGEIVFAVQGALCDNCRLFGRV